MSEREDRERRRAGEILHKPVKGTYAYFAPEEFDHPFKLEMFRMAGMIRLATLLPPVVLPPHAFRCAAERPAAISP